MIIILLKNHHGFHFHEKNISEYQTNKVNHNTLKWTLLKEVSNDGTISVYSKMLKFAYSDTGFQKDNAHKYFEEYLKIDFSFIYIDEYTQYLQNLHDLIKRMFRLQFWLVWDWNRRQ